MSKYTNNKNAQKGEEPATSSLSTRCLTRDKAGWVKAALHENLKLSEWVIKSLNEASGK